MNKVIKNILSKWYVYLATISVSSLLVIYLTSTINSPKNEETISIFFAGCGTNKTTCYQELVKNKPDYLRELNFYTAVYYNADFDNLFSTYAKGDSDIVIVPESKLFDNVITYYYMPLNEAYLEGIMGTLEYYSPEGNEHNYGIKIRTKGDLENTILPFTSYEHDEDYYAFFSKHSLHVGEMSKTNYVTAIDFVKIIKEYKKS